MTGACPMCGGRGLFRKRFKVVERCPRCDLPFEREVGGFIGTIAANTIFTEAALAISLAASLLLMAPEFPWLPLVLINLSVAAVVALATYPISQTTWTAVSVLMNPPDIKEVRPQYLP